MSPWVGRAMDRRAAKWRREKIMDEATRHAWIKIGTLVDYHAIIGGPVTKARMEVREPAQRLTSGHWVCWLKGKAGCVSVEAVTPHADGWLKCDCGAGSPAPSEVHSGMRVRCDECGTDWIGVGDSAHGYWINAQTNLLPGEKIDFGGGAR